MKELIENVLASRYATPEMVKIWSPKNKILIERKFWIAALHIQKEWGIDIPDGAIEAYEEVMKDIDLDAIAAKEIERRHDVIARIEAFNDLTIPIKEAQRQAEQDARAEIFDEQAGYQLIHKPFTSRDLTDCVEQYQIFQSLKLIRLRTISTLVRMGIRAMDYSRIDIAGRSHDIHGQTIKLGKRFANWAEELLIALHRLDQLIADYPFRGIKGPMGTQQDLINFMGDEETALSFEYSMRQHLGLPVTLDSVGQVYPRSLDFEVVSRLAQLSSAPGNMARTLRSMIGDGLAIEGFSKTQKGSSGMPHKILNARTCERINGTVGIIGGYLFMTQSLLGAQVNEGDVSCSIVRRVALPDSFYALDGLFQGAMTVLDEMGIFPDAIAKELKTAMPFLSSTSILQAIMKKTGMGRENAHTLIRDAAVEAIKGGEPESFIPRLIGTGKTQLSIQDVEEIISKPNAGASEAQIQKVLAKIKVWAAAYPKAAEYKPEPIL